MLKKYGLTNDEMEEFIKLNGEIIERAPETEKAISDQGNAYALTADKVKELNNRERERLMIQAREELKKALENEVTLLEKRSEEHTSELQSRGHLVCRLLLEKKKKKK